MANTGRTEMLLETEPNELEIMEFTIAGQLFGINVAKVLEIIRYSKVKPMQNAHPDIEGVFKPRDKIITVIDLAKHLHLPCSEDETRDILIVAAFNQQNFAFHAHSVNGICRVSWLNIQKPDPIIYGGLEGVATGIAEHQSRFIAILDFEKIIAEISPEAGMRVADIALLGPRAQTEKPILIAEDSMMLSKLIVESLNKAGYTNVIKAENGQEAWELLCEAKATGNPIKSQVACIISDIEMPLMDGHRLTKLVKEDYILKDIPVVLFSALINEAVLAKGRQAGADEQISKPEIANLIIAVDRLLAKGSE